MCLKMKRIQKFSSIEMDECWNMLCRVVHLQGLFELRTLLLMNVLNKDIVTMIQQYFFGK